jgi:hypothetical protein
MNSVVWIPLVFGAITLLCLLAAVAAMLRGVDLPD